ncbi:MAG: phosphopantothenoylcysteine decarboxylase domain-containing protein [Candidatus Hermodarchaeia archaeon]|jgi:hypothetical protein
MKILLTAGPIPAKLDSVKVVTNKFKGGLSALAAARLGEYFDVEVIKWEGAQLKLPPYIEVTNISDVLDYKDTVLSTEADAYILSAAVANLMPVSPWRGKFPSHNYSVGEEFDIKFTIAPRIIDQVKKEYPRSTLIGYKLLDGSEESLIQAGTDTMRQSRANVVFCNHPKTAKVYKVALTPDGSRIRMTFDEHIDFIRRTVNLKWYRTIIIAEGLQPSAVEAWKEVEHLKEILDEVAFYGGFGTIAVRAQRGFATTTRGKKGNGICFVWSADPETRTVIANTKATMNAPTIHRMFQAYPEARYILHSHKQIKELPTNPYAFPGTHEEDEMPLKCAFNVKHHGYYSALNSREELYAWIKTYHS